MNIKIDSREKDIIKMIAPLQHDLGLSISTTIETLPLGDFILSNEQEELLIIERKKLTDLAASIKDGRYTEQSYRLDGSEFPNHNVVYLIEGNIKYYKEKYTRVPKKTLYSAMFCLQYFKGFTVIRTEDAVETAELLLRMADKLRREKSKYGYYHSNFVPKQEKYSEVIKKVKKANVTPENASAIMLSQIPGISYQTAEAIMAAYPSMLALVDALKADKSCLDQITYETKSKQRRHISSTSIRNAKKFLMHKKEQIIDI